MYVAYLTRVQRSPPPTDTTQSSLPARSSSSSLSLYVRAPGFCGQPADTAGHRGAQLHRSSARRRLGRHAAILPYAVMILLCSILPTALALNVSPVAQLCVRQGLTGQYVLDEKALVESEAAAAAAAKAAEEGKAKK